MSDCYRKYRKHNKPRKEGRNRTPDQFTTNSRQLDEIISEIPITKTDNRSQGQYRTSPDKTEVLNR